MRFPSFAVLGLVALAGAWTPGSGAVAEESKAPPPDPLVVHEWGTFTSMSGADGVGLDGLQHEEEVLPEFVYSRSEVRACPLRRQGYKGLEVPVGNVTHKMETPVLYVHTQSARSLRVRVEFVGGLISQWYPVTDLLGPPEGPCDGGPLDMKTVERSFLEWDVDALPKDAAEPAEIPAVTPTDPWAYAREVDSAWLRTRPRKGPERIGPVEAERYLFYRGLGRLALPYRGEVLPDGSLLFENGGSVPFVVALEVGPRGERARYDIARHVAGDGDKIRVDLSKRAFAPLADVLPGLESDVQKILRGEGLFTDEARAMVRTWSRSWFRTEGTRLIHVVPQALTDKLLPLRITPAPDALVRVLVGRIELITPTVRAEVEAALLDAGSTTPALRDAAEARLARLGRFLEPHLKHVLAQTKDPAVRKAAESRLDTVR